MMRTPESKCAGVEPGAFCAPTTMHTANTNVDQAAEKAFRHLQARFAACGHRLSRTVDIDGTVELFAGLGCYSRELADLAAAERFLAQIGGDQ